jgi:Phosphotransferase enzyme family
MAGDAHTKTPGHLAEITPEWLTYALHSGGVAKNAKVVGMEGRQIGQGVGFLSSVDRLALRYDRPDHDGPASVVVKVEPETELLRELGEEMHAFEREIRFYREVGADAPIRLARVYYSAIDPPDYAIVMEDLSYCEPGDQIAGMHESLVKATVRTLGKLQAKYWNNRRLEPLAWMPDTFEFVDHFLPYWPSFVERCSNWVSPEGMALGHRLARSIDWLKRELAAAPRTLVHYDLREDNLLFGPSGTPEEVVIVDWQLTIRGLGAYDVASLMASSEKASERVGHQKDVAACWHEVLLSSGVENYDFDQALYHFRVASLAALCVPVRYHQAGMDSGFERGRELIKCQCRRMFDSAVEIDAGSILTD